MQQMQDASDDHPTPEQCAALLLETTPLVMRTIRAQMRGYRAADLSVPQFRALGFVRRHAGASLSELAEHLGLTAPATSRLVDGLVARGYVLRQSKPRDRRTLELTASPRGVAMLDSTRERTLADLRERLAPLADADRAALVSALETLRALFASGRATPAGTAAGTVTANGVARALTEDMPL